MDAMHFEQLVCKLERESGRAPRRYRLKVAALALLGFGILAAIVSIAGLGLLAIVALLVAVAATGGKAAILLVNVGKLLILLAIPLWLLVKSSCTALLTRLPRPEGQELTRDEAPQLFAALDDLRARMKGPRFHHVLITDDVNAAVMQRPLLGLFGLPRNYLILGLPLLESLPPVEALAVVAHEYGHLAGSHSRFGAFIYRLRLSWVAIQALSNQWQGWAGRLLQRLIHWYAPYFNAYTFVLARANEYQADAASAELVGAVTAASALKRVNIAAASYEAFLQKTFEDTRHAPAPPADLADRWALGATATLPDGLAQRWLGDSLDRRKLLHDTHPVLRSRLQALALDTAQLEAVPEPMLQASAAQHWLGGHATALRSSMQARWREQVQAGWRAQHEHMRSGMARLAELRSLAQPSRDEEVERLRLQVQLEPETDSLAELADFNAREPDHPLALYLEGVQRLQRGDENGLALLEQAMSLDDDAVKPGCQQAFAFLKERAAAERASAYAQRWNARDAWETARAQQLEHLDFAHELRAPELDAEQLATVKALLAAHAKGIARAWLLRRVLPTDPRVATYVLCIEPTRWSRWRSRGPSLVAALARLEWPMHAFFCTLDALPEWQRRKPLELPDARVLG